MSEIKIMHQIQLAASKIGARLFRNNVGLAYAGRQVIKFSKPITIQALPGDILIRSGHAIKFGLIEGSSDLIGWTKDGEFLAIEVKTDTGILTEEQLSFVDAVNSSGGIGIIAKSPDDLIKRLS